MIEVSGLTAGTGDAVLLDGVGLTVRPGEITALAGPSGSGKTTTALALLGEAPPGVRLTGDVRVAGVPVVDASGPTERAPSVRGGTVAYLPQHPGTALNPARRIGPVLTELARLHGRAKPGDALRRAQLPGDRATYRRFPHQFSGGQRQRIALAQALACAPCALILDEPSTGLDTVTRLALARELTALAGDGMAILLLSHDHALIRALAGHVVLLESGRVSATGGPDLLPPAATPGWTSDGDNEDPDPGYNDGPGGRPGNGPRARPGSQPGNGSGGDGPALFEVCGLSAWLRPGRRGGVLHDISLRLGPGESVALAGRSGSGKSTFARCLAGLHERHDGTLRLDGAALPVLRRRSTEQKRRVQYAGQEVRGSFDERRTVLDQVARTAVRLRGRSVADARAEAVTLLARLGVAEDTARRPATALSGGELQRAAVARAVLARPDVLICDEISTALDDAATAVVADELARLRREDGTAVLWIGHDLRLVPAVADRLLILDAGRVAERGPSGRVLAAPRADATVQLVEAARLGVRQPEEELS